MAAMIGNAVSMTGWILLWLAAALVLVLALLLVSKVGIRLRYDGTFTAIARLGVFRLNITRFLARPEKKKKPRVMRFTEDGGLFGESSAGKVLAKSSRRVRHRGANTVKKAPEKTEKKNVPEMIRLFAELLGEAAVKLSGYARVDVRRLYAVAAAPEAADTAVLFGHMNTAMGLLLCECRRFKQFRLGSLRAGVYADFTATEPRFDADIELTFRVWQPLFTAIGAGKRYVEEKRITG